MGEREKAEGRISNKGLTSPLSIMRNHNIEQRSSGSMYDGNQSSSLLSAPSMKAKLREEEDVP